MKIAILVKCLTNGGAERVASLWARGFYEQGHEVCLLLKDPSLPITYVVPNEVDIVPMGDNNGKMLTGINADIRLRQVVKSIKPDYLICVLDGEGIHARLATLGLGVKVIQTEHNSFERPENVAFTFKQKFFKFFCNRFMPAVTVLTQADKDFIGKRLKNVHVLPNPLAFEPAKSVPPKSNIIFAAGRLDAGYTKGFDILLKAFAKVVPEHSDWQLQIAGGGSIKNTEKYTKMAQELGISSNVRFLGYIMDVVELYKQSSIFVLSSRYEGFGMVLIEAMSQGCACIACDYKGRQKEIINSEEYGIICQPDDIDDLAKAMRKLIESQDEREMIQKHSIERSRCYDISIIMNTWSNILKIDKDGHNL